MTEQLNSLTAHLLDRSREAALKTLSKRKQSVLSDFASRGVLGVSVLGRLGEEVETVYKHYATELIEAHVNLAQPFDSPETIELLRLKLDVALDSGMRCLADAAATRIPGYPNAKLGSDFESELLSGAKRDATIAFQAAQLKAIRIGGKQVANNRVFVVHGRDGQAKEALFTFLSAAGLQPMEWGQVVKLTGKGSPYIGEVLVAGLKEAQAIVVLFTGDDLVSLRRDLLEVGEPPEEPTLQPRPNVLLEAGMALGLNPDRTIIVELGKLRGLSDLLGRHVVRIGGGSAHARNELLERLATAGCPVDRAGHRWLAAGDFP